MKVVCAIDSVTETKGIFTKRTETNKIDGLTKGKKYTAVVYPKVKGSSSQYGGSTDTHCYFMVYNDNKSWQLYEPDMFAPGEE